MKKETEFLYSVGLAGFALLNQDGTMPSPNNWKDVDNQGMERKHKGGLIGKSGTFDLTKLKDEDFDVGVLYGSKKTTFKFVSTSADKAKATVVEIVKDLNTVFEKTGAGSLKKEGIELKAEASEIEGVEYIRIYDSSLKLPFYAPIGFSGLLPLMLGIVGYSLTEEVKSVKSDFEKESGKSVDVTSGHGIRCVVKEADKIKGLNLTISLAGLNTRILSMITGHRYNEKDDEFFVDNAGKTPTFAFMYFVKAFAKGENNESSFEKVKVVAFPSCQATLPGDNAQEGAFATMELQASSSANKKSNLPMMFYKGISLSDYSTYIENI
ncbi:MAG: hypothetical protein ACTTJ3_02945 [Treponema sp.]